MAAVDGPVRSLTRAWSVDSEVRAEASCLHHSASKSGNVLMVSS